LCLVISKCPLEDRRRRKKEVSFRLAPACREVLFNVRECVISDVCNQISFRFLSRLFLWILFPPWSIFLLRRLLYLVVLNIMSVIQKLECCGSWICVQFLLFSSHREFPRLEA
jgi:hypothetical protein